MNESLGILDDFLALPPQFSHGEQKLYLLYQISLTTNIYTGIHGIGVYVLSFEERRGRGGKSIYASSHDQMLAKVSSSVLNRQTDSWNLNNFCGSLTCF